MIVKSVNQSDHPTVNILNFCQGTNTLTWECGLSVAGGSRGWNRASDEVHPRIGYGVLDL